MRIYEIIFFIKVYFEEFTIYMIFFEREFANGSHTRRRKKLWKADSLVHLHKLYQFIAAS
jgi:hypothetical protein